MREEVKIYAAPEGRPLRMSLFLPSEQFEGPCPAIVLIHGGAWIGGFRHQLHWFGRAFARAGFVAASIEYRKLPQFGFPECLHDAKAAVRYLRAHAAGLNIDPDRIVASGHSAGGYIAMMLACTGDDPEFEGTENLGYSSAVQAAVSVYGAVDLRAYRQPYVPRIVGGLASPVLDRFLRTVVAAAAEAEDPFEKASPAACIHPDMCPSLFIHGTQDFLVPLRVAEEMHQGLTGLGVPAKLVTFHRRGHAFERFSLPARREVFREMINFLHAQGICREPALTASE